MSSKRRSGHGLSRKKEGNIGIQSKKIMEESSATVINDIEANSQQVEKAIEHGSKLTINEYVREIRNFVKDGQVYDVDVVKAVMAQEEQKKVLFVQYTGYIDHFGVRADQYEGCPTLSFVLQTVVGGAIEFHFPWSMKKCLVPLFRTCESYDSMEKAYPGVVTVIGVETATLGANKRLMAFYSLEYSPCVIPRKPPVGSRSRWAPVIEGVTPRIIIRETIIRELSEEVNVVIAE
ncbi:hypothetical protein DM01DRAFT_1336653 [Hesseltinella vesiculosa]|uniref:Uncharacterized protein n=1 Tax=Hesseltinella vesiculosa TaxID=101127 RepID=A0A1X2GG18_9FUNG|nr:hypothetical protein DM01DRAFT_1336653 [Hesseltinella vesiculosa]